MKFRIEIEENDRGLAYQPWPWNLMITRSPNGCTVSTYATTLHDALHKAEEIIKENL